MAVEPFRLPPCRELAFFNQNLALVYGFSRRAAENVKIFNTAAKKILLLTRWLYGRVIQTNEKCFVENQFALC
jgi:hypothetical protein